MLLAPLLLFAFYLTLPPFLQAQAYSGECGSCVDRKQVMCADECELVTPDRSRKCQQDCIAEYCSHKCEKTAPELAAYLQENCEECLEKQYVLCEVHCPEGRPRKRAACQLNCSDDRCKTVCAPNEKPAEKMVPPKVDMRKAMKPAPATPEAPAPESPEDN